VSAPTDVLQAVAEAIVASLNADPSITAITGRTGDNIVTWNSLESAKLPVLVYLLVNAREVGGLNWTWDVDLQLDAYAVVSADANNLRHAAQQLLISPTFSALANPIDAMSLNRVLQTFPFDEASDSYRTSITMTIRIPMPAL